MHKRSTYRVLALLLALGMLFSMFGTTTVRAANAEPQAKITVAPEVLTEMEAKGTASYWIEFAAKADLSAAYKMGWSERGWYVYETLSQAQPRLPRLASPLTWRTPRWHINPIG